MRENGRGCPGTGGEVTLEIRGGYETFYAYASDHTVTTEKGVKVRVDDHQPPLTVYVSPVEPARAAVQDIPARSSLQHTNRHRSSIQDTAQPPHTHHSST